MKRNYFVAGVLLFGMLLTGCGKDNEFSPEVEPGFEGKMEEVTPLESKSRLQNIGLEFVDAIDATTHDNLIGVTYYVGEKLSYFDVDRNYTDKLSELVSISGGYEDEYYAHIHNVNPVEAIQGMMAMSLDVAQNGAQLATRVDDIFMFTLKAGLKDLYGGFKPNMKTEKWEYNQNITDRLEIEFTDDQKQTWVATLKGSKETTNVRVAVEKISQWKDNYMDWSDEGGYHEKFNISLEIPTLITFVVKCNNAEVVNLTVNSNLAFDADMFSNHNSEYKSGFDENDNWFYDNKYESKLDLKVDYTNLNLDASLDVNGYNETWKTTATKSGFESKAEVKINGKSMLKAEAALAADVDALITQLCEESTGSWQYSSYDDDDYEEDEDFKFISTTIKNFAVKIDVMGKAQIYGKCDSFEQMYKALLDDDKYYDYENDIFNFEEYAKYVDRVNDTYSITVHYDNTKTVQANIEFEAYEYESEWDEGYMYHDIRPILIFAADNSRYTFEDYFTENSFKDFVDAIEDLAEEFDDMYGDYFEEDVVYPDYGEDYHK